MRRVVGSASTIVRLIFFAVASAIGNAFSGASALGPILKGKCRKRRTRPSRQVEPCGPGAAGSKVLRHGMSVVGAECSAEGLASPLPHEAALGSPGFVHLNKTSIVAP